MLEAMVAELEGGEAAVPCASGMGATTARRLDAAAKAQMGIGPGLARLSVGLEAVEDLMADLTGALTT